MARRIQQKPKSIEEKLRIIEEIESGIKASEICRRENLPKSTVGTWIKNKKQIKLSFEKGKISSKRDKSTSNDDLDKVLIEWFKQKRSERIPLDGSIILEKANSFLQAMGSTETVSRSWIDRWKKRHNIAAQKVVGEAGSVNVDAIEQ